MERKYIGAKYVPTFADPSDWDINRSYDGLTMVTNDNKVYTSKKRVPVGIQLTNAEYWVKTSGVVKAEEVEVTPISGISGDDVQSVTENVWALLNHFTNENGTVTHLGTYDVNTVRDTGFYTVGNSSPNLPTTNGGYLYVTKFDNAFAKQFFSAFYNSDVYVRTLNGGNWSAWESLNKAESVTVGSNAVLYRYGKLRKLYLNGTNIQSNASLNVSIPQSDMPTVDFPFSGNGIINDSGTVKQSIYDITNSGVYVRNVTGTIEAYNTGLAFGNIEWFVN